METQPAQPIPLHPIHQIPLYQNQDDEQRKEMWDIVAKELAQPISLRKKHTQIIAEWDIPESTFYWITSKKDFNQRIVEIALNEAKRWIPELIDVLKDKALVDKSEKSIEMALKYIAETKDRLDLTSKEEKIVKDPSKLSDEDLETLLKQYDKS